MTALLGLLGLVTIIASAWWYAGKLFEPQSVGSGACDSCGRLAPLFHCCGSRRCRACYDLVFGAIP